MSSRIFTRNKNQCLLVKRSIQREIIAPCVRSVSVNKWIVDTMSDYIRYDQMAGAFTLFGRRHPKAREETDSMLWVIDDIERKLKLHGSSWFEKSRMLAAGVLPRVFSARSMVGRWGGRW